MAKDRLLPPSPDSSLKAVYSRPLPIAFAFVPDWEFLSLDELLCDPDPDPLWLLEEDWLSLALAEPDSDSERLWLLEPLEDLDELLEPLPEDERLVEPDSLPLWLVLWLSL